MNYNITHFFCTHKRCIKKILLTMRFTIFFITVFFIQVSAKTYGQKLTLQKNNLTLSELFSEIRHQTGYGILISTNRISPNHKISVHVDNTLLTDVLESALSNKNLSYTIEDKTIIIVEAERKKNVLDQQLYRVSGKVVNERSESMTGVTIRTKGNSKSYEVLTDRNGNYNIDLTTDITSLEFSFIGYRSQQIDLKSKSDQKIDIKLIEDIYGLDQIQVTAYGTTTRRIGTGNIAHITAKEISESPATSLAEVLKDRIPGLFITQKTGVAGGAFDITVRGVNNISAEEPPNPLFIVDGVAYPAGMMPLRKDIYGKAGAQQQGNYLNYINKDDVESISVLKDADATAIYGSRGAYGVIIITTKRAKEGSPRLSVNYSKSLIQRATSPDLLNTEQYLMLRREAIANDGLEIGSTDLDLNGSWPIDRYNNWVDVLTGKMASTDRLNATYSAGRENTNFVLGTSYSNQGNIQRGKGNYQDVGVRFNINNISNNKKLYIDFGGTFNSNINDQIPFDLSSGGGFTAAPNGPPLFNSDGTINWERPYNPAASINNTYKSVINNLMGRTSLSYKPIENLDIKLTLGYNIVSGDENIAQPSTSFQPGIDRGTNVYSAFSAFSTRTWTADPFVTYSKALGDLGKLSLSTGATLQGTSNSSNSITGMGFATDALLNNPALGQRVLPFYKQAEKKYLGFFGLANYNYANKYIVNLSVRRDASNKFGIQNRWGTFGSFAGAWNFSEEKWFKENISIISFAKIRSSYGISGGDAIPDYAHLSTYTIQQEQYQDGYALINTGIENPDLRWDKTKKFEVGGLFEVLNGRLSFDASYYRNLTLDQLLSEPLPSITGYSSFFNNVAIKFENTGYELSLNGIPLQTQKLNWRVSLQLSLPKSKLLSLPPRGEITNLNYVVGKPVTGLLVYKYEGVDPDNGLHTFINAQGERTTNTNMVTWLGIDDRTEFLDLFPKYYGSIRNEFNYQAFSFSFIFNIRNRVGKTFLGSQMYLPGYFDINTTTAALRRWQQPGDITDVPKPTTNGLINILSQPTYGLSTGAYERITYARLQNVNLSYSFPKKMIEKARIRNLNIFVQGENLLTISKYKDLDPENTSATSLPPLRYFNLGFNITL